ncbi:hypothetical protein [Streptomonospora salina]|uniref:Lipoprotein n=1 Tax=Streptomonospora salina TaxID=104205 RepID=A0A841E0V8_9ACTN|nr:hypothetical protein [Streptomonospora salina]MBB5997397.1 hypothetical protein [Streptomonospora salina]
MRSAVHTGAATAALMAGVALAAGCAADDGGGGDGGASDAPSQEQGAGQGPSPESAAEGGMDGVWESTVDDSDYTTLTVLGEDVRTDGDAACSGTLDPADSGPAATIELDCPDTESRSGSAELNAEGDHLIVNWDGTDGFPEAFARTDEEPVIEG